MTPRNISVIAIITAIYVVLTYLFGIGEFSVCYLLGLPFIYLIERYRHLMPWQKP